MKKPILFGIVGLALLLAVPPFLKNYGIYLFSYWLVFVIANMGLNLTVGYAGQKSLGHAAFFGIGAYSVAILMKAGFSFWLGLPVAAVGCFVIGLGLGFPALRVQTIYLAFATLGFNTAIWLVMRNEEWLTGGTFGINNVGRPGFFGLELDSNLAYYYFVLAMTIVVAALLWGLLRSPWGKAFTALRDNPIRAESTGVNITAYTLLAFAIGAACAGIGGVYLSALVNFIEPGQFHLSVSLMMLLAVIALVIERLLLRHLYDKEHLMQLLFTFAIVLLMSDAAKMIWGTDQYSVGYPPGMGGAVNLGFVMLPQYQLFLCVVGPLIAVAMWFVVDRTRWGRVVRAATQDREMLAALGVNVPMVYAAVFTIGSALAGVGGALAAPRIALVPGMDATIINECFIIVIIGGLGNLWGSFLGALAFGFVVQFGTVLAPNWQDVLPYLLMLVVLIIRPWGVLGRPEAG